MSQEDDKQERAGKTTAVRQKQEASGRALTAVHGGGKGEELGFLAIGLFN